MCGIAGLLAPFPADRLKAAALSLANAQQHRGPDGAGVHVHRPVVLAHRRLSIIDLEAGAQPLANEDETVWITFNGEIYNYRELRGQLESRGHRFRTRSDTEVIVHAYEEWGDACVTHLRGMFAFAIDDARRHRLFLARDHFGIKPLVYLEQDGWFAFASEVQAFHSLTDAVIDLDVRAIDEYLGLQYIPAPRSVYRQVRKLPPGHTMSVEYDGRVHGPQRYWRPEFSTGAARTDAQWLEEFEQVLLDSVRAHLVADVPVGAFLSGGLDSTAVVALAQQLATQPIRTFSIGFRDPAHDESSWAADAARVLGTNHRCEIVDVDALASLPDLVRHYGEPFGDSSAVATMAVARMAAQEVKTVLTGDGGDEGMAGYHSHVNWLQWVSGQGDAMLRRPPVDAWMRTIQYCDPHTRASLWAGDQQGRTMLPIESFEQAWTEARDLGVVQRVQYMDATTYLPNDILTKVDIASMAHSLETRTPLIDVDVWKLLTQLPERLNVGTDPHGQLSGKHLLKKFLSRWFPQPFVHRRKQGFAVPLARWFAPDGDARAMVEDRLFGSTSHLRSLFDPAPARHLLRNGHHGPVWVLLVLEEWLRQAAARSAAAPVTLASEQVTISPPALATPVVTTAPVRNAEHRTARETTARPRVLAIADVPNWIFERHARYLRRLLADEFEITIQYHTASYDESEWDLIYPLEFGLVPGDAITMPWKYVTALRSHVSWSAVSAQQLGLYLQQNFQRTHVVSQRLQRELAPFLPDVAYVTHGIDGDVFQPRPRDSRAGAKLRVGWAGNRQTAVKGFDEFIKPLGDIDGVELVFCGYADRNLSLEEMADWYAGIDVYVCASLSEGSNNALLEASAMQCAIVTTDNGTVPEYLQDGHSAFIVPRQRDAFVRAITALRDDAPLRRRFGDRAAAAVLPPWTWQCKAADYRALFREALNEAPAARRRMAASTRGGQRWMVATIARLQDAMARGQLDEARPLADVLIDVDPSNAGFRDVRAALIDAMQESVFGAA